MRLWVKFLVILCLTLAGVGMSAHFAKAAKLLSVEGDWVAPGLRTELGILFSAMKDNQVTVGLGEVRGSGQIGFYTVTEHSDTLLFLKDSQKDEIGLIKISDNALLFANGWITDMLIVRRGLESKTSPPSGGLWKEGNYFRKDRMAIDFTKLQYSYGAEVKNFRTEPALDQRQFPGLTQLVGDDGKAFMECVCMGDDVTACRQPPMPKEQGGGGDNAFIGFARAENVD